MTHDEMFFAIIFGGPVLFATVVGLYDLLAERQKRHEHEREQRRSA